MMQKEVSGPELAIYYKVCGHDLRITGITIYFDIENADGPVGVRVGLVKDISIRFRVVDVAAICPSRNTHRPSHPILGHWCP